MEGWREAVRERVEEATKRYQSYSAYDLRNALEVAMLKSHPHGHLLYIEERVLLDVVHQRLKKLEALNERNE